jgi:hypothetical protein
VALWQKTATFSAKEIKMPLDKTKVHRLSASKL